MGDRLAAYEEVVDAMRAMRSVIACAAIATVCALAVGRQAGAQPGQDAVLLSDLRWQRPGVVSQPERDTAGLPRLAIPALSAAPRVDGDLGDQAWQEAVMTDPWMVSTGEAEAPVQTRAWLGTFAGRLYIGLKCEEPSTDTMLTRVTEDGGAVWEDDCVELFFDGNLDLTTYRQIALNSLGVATSLPPRGGEWQPALEKAARVGDGDWSAELSLPVDDLDAMARTIGLNLCRERRAGGEVELSCWSATGGGFGLPHRFGLATLGVPYIESVSLGEGILGLNLMELVLANDGPETRTLRARLRWSQEGEQPGEVFTMPRRVGPEQRRKFPLGYHAYRPDQPLELELSVLDQDDTVVTTRRFTQRLATPLQARLLPRLFFLDEHRAGLSVQLNVGGDILDRGQLVVAIFREPGRELVARQEFEDLRPGSLTAAVSLPDLELGKYSLHVILKERTADGVRRVAESKQVIHKLTGPFDEP